MNLADYEALLAAEHEKLSPPEFEKFLVDELLELMRVNIGLISENVELRKKLAICEEGRPNQ